MPMIHRNLRSKAKGDISSRFFRPIDFANAFAVTTSRVKLAANTRGPGCLLHNIIYVLGPVGKFVRVAEKIFP